MEYFINLIWTNGASFLFILTVIVFFHELGHYAVARANGIRIEVFSIGFGPELFGWTSKSGTRWKVSLLPLGGYVKMFGETMSGAGDDEHLELTEEEQSVSFHHKTVWQRSAVVVAGPLANFVLAVVVLSVLFATDGQPFTPPEAGRIIPGSAAQAAGMKAGDTFVKVGSLNIERFEDLQNVVRLSPGKKMTLVVRRDGRNVALEVVPKKKTMVDRFCGKTEIGLLGVHGPVRKYIQHDLLESVYRAAVDIWRFSVFTLEAVGQMITGRRSADGLGGPIRIAQISGEVAERGLGSLFWFLAILSMNLGLINLFPIPMLDGGHLVFYGIEAIQGRAVSDRIMEYGFRVGLGLVICLFVFVTFQDLCRFEFIANFFKVCTC